MDLPGSRFFLSVENGTVSAQNELGQQFFGGCLDTDIPFEELGFPELIARMQSRIIERKAKGSQFIFANECKSLKQARAAVFASRKEKLPLLLCMDCEEDGSTIYGDDVIACLIALQELKIFAFGISGSLTPQECAEVLDKLAPFAKIPLLAAPTAGEPNPILPDLYDLAPEKMADSILPVLEHGVTMLAENHGVTKEHSALLQKRLFSYDNSAIQLEKEDEEDHIILSNNRAFFIIHDERLEFTEPLLCEQDMSDRFLQAEEESYDVLLVRVETPDDVPVFAENQSLAGLPVMFSSDDEISLKSALLLYDGRAMIDSECAIEEETLREIADKYGCVLY